MPVASPLRFRGGRRRQPRHQLRPSPGWRIGERLVCRRPCSAWPPRWPLTHRDHPAVAALASHQSGMARGVIGSNASTWPPCSASVPWSPGARRGTGGRCSGGVAAPDRGCPPGHGARLISPAAGRRGARGPAAAWRYRRGPRPPAALALARRWETARSAVTEEEQELRRSSTRRTLPRCRTSPSRPPPWRPWWWPA
jgi:hypothetical protein